jgi:hypothetical protein
MRTGSAGEPGPVSKLERGVTTSVSRGRTPRRRIAAVEPFTADTLRRLGVLLWARALALAWHYGNGAPADPAGIKIGRFVPGRRSTPTGACSRPFSIARRIAA